MPHSGPHQSHAASRSLFVNGHTLNDAANAFVAAIGSGNAEYLRSNLRLTLVQSDALRALNAALTRDFNIVRQDEIRREQEADRV
jgi:hypothetical protein